MHRLTRSIWRSVLVGAIALLPLPTLRAAADPTPRPTAASQPASGRSVATTAPATISATDLADLDHDQYSIRQEATRRLLADNTLTPDAIAAGFARAATLEQKHRLLEIARHHFLRTVRKEVFAGEPMGSIGIAISSVPTGSEPGLEKPAIRVQSTMPGFPAYPLLQSGDLITAVNGRRPQENDTVNGTDLEFKQMIFTAAQTGRPINLTVIRDGQSQQINVEPAGQRSLNVLYDSRTGQWAELVQQQWERYQKFLDFGSKTGSPPGIVASSQSGGGGQSRAGHFDIDFAQLKAELIRMDADEPLVPMAP